MESGDIFNNQCKTEKKHYNSPKKRAIKDEIGLANQVYADLDLFQFYATRFAYDVVEHLSRNFVFFEIFHSCPFAAPQNKGANHDYVSSLIMFEFHIFSLSGRLVIGLRRLHRNSDVITKTQINLFIIRFTQSKHIFFSFCVGNIPYGSNVYCSNAHSIALNCILIHVLSGLFKGWPHSYGEQQPPKCVLLDLLVIFCRTFVAKCEFALNAGLQTRVRESHIDGWCVFFLEK